MIRNTGTLTRLAIAIAITVTLPPAAYAQGAPTGTTPEQTVSDILGFLVTNRGVQTDDFDRDREAAASTRDTLTRALLASVATVPVTSSSGGFTYRLNPALGTVERASETFGPFFVERALTSGAGQASLGFTLTYASFNSLDGRDLRSGTLVTTANQFSDETAAFDVERLTLRIATRTATLFGNIGLNERVDLGVSVPLVHLSVQGERENNYRGRTLLQARASATTTGLADIAVRSKIRLTPDGPRALSAGVEVRLPTGREDDLLGAGDAALRFAALASAESGDISVYGNFGLGFGGVGREVSYGGAVALAATPQVTLVGEFLGRRIAGLAQVAEVTEPHPRIRGVATTRLIPSGGDQTTAFVVAGTKWNVVDTWLVHAHVLLPVVRAGLTARITPTLALDYSW